MKKTVSIVLIMLLLISLVSVQFALADDDDAAEKSTIIDELGVDGNEAREEIDPKDKVPAKEGLVLRAVPDGEYQFISTDEATAKDPEKKYRTVEVLETGELQYTDSEKNMYNVYLEPAEPIESTKDLADIDAVSDGEFEDIEYILTANNGKEEYTPCVIGDDGILVKIVNIDKESKAQSFPNLYIPLKNLFVNSSMKSSVRDARDDEKQKRSDDEEKETQLNEAKDNIYDDLSRKLKSDNKEPVKAEIEYTYTDDGILEVKSIKLIETGVTEKIGVIFVFIALAAGLVLSVVVILGGKFVSGGKR